MTEQVSELVRRWGELRRQGKQPSLETLCAGRPDLLPELERELGTTRDSASAVGPEVEAATLPPETVGTDAAIPPPPAAADGGPPAPAVPGYEILGELGRGGMGVVYRARQVGLNRPVALKMVLAGGHAGAGQLARFRAEAEAVARLRHPNVVQVYAVGDHGGLPYLALEYADGGSLAEALDGTPWPAAQAAALVETLAGAVQAAHAAGVVHRDLKPGNVLLTADGLPKVTDFGLAKRLDGAALTATGEVMGTPSYMAPEQAEGKRAVGPAADVYALGAILYELLTGRPPFKAATPLDTVLQVVSDDPVPPSRLRPKLPKDLETVCLKCLEKDPRQRYPGARALADDLARFRAGEPVRARPVGAVERAAKWARRRPALAAAWGLASVLLVLGPAAAGAAWLWQQAVQARHQAEGALAGEQQAKAQAEQALEGERTALEGERQARHAAEEARDESRRISSLRTLDLAHREWQQANVTRAEQLLAGYPRDLRGWEWEYVHHLCHSDVLSLRGEFTDVAFSPDGKHLATTDRDQIVKVWDSATGRQVCSVKAYTFAYSPDGRYPASPSPDGVMRVRDAATGREIRSFLAPSDGVFKMWDAANRREVRYLRGPEGRLVFSPDGRRLAGVGGEVPKLWDAMNGREVLSFKDPTTWREYFASKERLLTGVAFSPDGRRVAGGSTDGTLKVWDAQTGRHILTLKGHTARVNGVGFSPDGKRLASAGADRTVRLWDVASGREALALRGHTAPVNGVTFSADGKRLASASDDQTVRVWDAATGEEVSWYRGHTYPVSGVAFSPDGRRLASLSWGGMVKVWDATTKPEARVIKGHAGEVWGLAFSPDGRHVASTSWDQTVRVWDAATGQQLRSLKGHDVMAHVAFSPDGRRLAATSQDKTAWVWEVATGRQVFRLRGHAGAGTGVAFSPDGRRLATAAVDQTVRLWDAATGREALAITGHKGPVWAVAFSPDSKCLASTSSDRTVRLWDAATGREILTFKGHTGVVYGVAFSPDGRHLATASDDETVRLWDAATGRRVRTIPVPIQGYRGHATSVAFSPDGRCLATNLGERAVQVWDVATGQEALTLKGHTDIVRGVAFSPDGRRLASASNDGTVMVWDAGPKQAEQPAHP